MSNVRKNNNKKKQASSKTAKLTVNPTRSSIVRPGMSRRSPGPSRQVVNYTRKNADILPGSMRYSGKELFATLSDNSTPFKLLGNSATTPGYDINPGCALLFPWLSSLSRSFEKYKFNKLEFEVVPKAPTTATGSFYAAIDYDWEDTPALSAQDLMINKGAICSNVWSPCIVKVDVARLNQDLEWRYVLSNGRTEIAPRFVYGGYFQCGIAGTVAAVSFDVFVHYDITLNLPCNHQGAVTSTYTYATTYALPQAVFSSPPQLPNVRGIPTVVMGQNGVPAPNGLQDAYQANPSAYDVRNLADGVITVLSKISTAGVTPESVALDTTGAATYFDSNGLYLGRMHTSEDSQIFAGPEGASWAQQGGIGRLVTNLALSKIRQVYPTLAYIMLHLYSGAGRDIAAGSTITTSAKLEL